MALSKGKRPFYPKTKFLAGHIAIDNNDNNSSNNKTTNSISDKDTKICVDSIKENLVFRQEKKDKNKTKSDNDEKAKSDLSDKAM